MKTIPEIRLFGTENCHKTKHYIAFFKNKNLPFLFFDVLKNKESAEILRNLYTNKKLNFPTITIGTKKLRNPQDEVLDKWLSKSL
ncbi:glutaredoxin domain-containing protein [Kordia zhangzhouensis]|uniref:glutaredoxin domain-containing protein n=1 Tax=Kordia zhangzhouensis TaxID=1620405 RepID=UPI000629389F|nr:glutaredoxin domain-containing protein [Kordia zhangzhouensis]